MRITILFFGLLLINTTLIAQDDDYLLISLDTITGECGYVDTNGEAVIPIRKYPVCLTDTFRTFAVVYKTNRGFVGINRQEEVLFQLMQHGREPDFPREGVFRIVVDNKIGFANLDGEIVVPPVYDMVLPFNEGLAAYCENCGTDRLETNTKWSNGSWGFIDKTGKVVIPPVYDMVLPFNEGLAAYCENCRPDQSGTNKKQSNDSWGFIDKTGEVVIKAQFQSVRGGFKDDKVKVKLKNKWIFIDKTGEVIK